MIVEAGWYLVVEAHTIKAHKARKTAEQRQIALENAVADMLAKRGVERDGAFFAERVARDATETREQKYTATRYAGCLHEKIEYFEDVEDPRKSNGQS